MEGSQENHICIRVVGGQVYIRVRTKNKEQSRKGANPEAEVKPGTNILGQTPTQAMTSLMADKKKKKKERKLMSKVDYRAVRRVSA
jgi:hypothetical protein